MIQDLLLRFFADYGYIGLFAALILGIVGLPLPDELLMLFAGFMVSKGELRFVPTVLVALSGSMIGISLSYFIGYRFGFPLLEKYGRRIHLTPEKLEKAERWFSRFGKFTVTFGYFFPGIRHITSLSAGISKWSYGTLFLYAFPGALIWVFTFIPLGIHLQEDWRIVAGIVRKFTWGIVIVVVALAMVGWRIQRRLKKRRAG
ncbi:DedA family protein [Effusibacillus dendaii]|uniref:Alkaline phosphatase n=1 Tax=Effusibacillus dendaii TaxID=2743772 RepID=A0A7I8DHG0_9BACL|nr:DedA family protein [Effusibacillus dendaii]BCJ88346.1 alkaline phosphatase [Effusibacillus dendaii]